MAKNKSAAAKRPTTEPAADGAAAKPVRGAKTQAALKYIAEHPNAKAKEIAGAVGCSIPMASSVLKGESKGGKTKKAKKVGPAKSESTNGNQFAQAIAFVKSMGGIANAKAAIDDLAGLEK